MIRRFLQRVWRMEEEVMGMNRRNLELIGPSNPRPWLALAKDKLRTKQLLAGHDVPVPRSLAVFDRLQDVAGLEKAIRPLDGFVIKPANGARGKGILVVRRGPQGTWQAAGGSGRRRLRVDDLQAHVAAIMSGVYCTNRLTDRAFLEELLSPVPLPGGLAEPGLPDVRIIVLHGRAIMAMLRLPTRQSGGRANLHQGALGLGVDLATGQTIHAILRNRPICRHPETGAALIGVRVPHWLDALRLAATAGRISRLGYLGVDIVLARDRGPLVLEINAHPGLSIQLANRLGLSRFAFPKSLESRVP